MDKNYELLIEALEQAETPEEKHDAIVAILKARPKIKEIMWNILMMEKKEQEQTIRLYNEILKPHKTSS